jgi:hypothetical protein
MMNGLLAAGKSGPGFHGKCYRSKRRGAEARGGRGGGVTAGPETVRLPSDAPQRAQTSSCSSPEGSTSSKRSRTGCEVLQFGQ